MRRPAALAVGILLLSAGAAVSDDVVLASLPALHSGGLRVYLVRHGQALSNLDPPPALPERELDHLTELGLEQAAAVGRALAGRGVSAVLSSPAVRARETADAIASATGTAAPAIESRLAPMAVGQREDGRPLSWDERIAEWQAGRDPRPRGGESLEQVGDRVRQLVLSLARSRRGRSIVMVAHSEVIGAYLGRVRRAPAPQRHPFGIANGSISVVDVQPTGAAWIQIANHVAHQP